MPIPRLARELGLTPRQTRYRLLRMRKKFLRRLGALGMLVLMLATFAMVAGPGLIATRDTPVPGNGMQPGRPMGMSSRHLAGVRDEALRACNAGEWDACVAGLDELRRLDPTGDETTEMKVARARAKRAHDDELRNLDAKP